MNTVPRTLLCTTAALAAPVLAQTYDPVGVWPSSGRPAPHVATHSVDDSHLLARPPHPPLNEIPPMPMPVDTGWRPRLQRNDGVTRHDAETGQTVRLPLSMRSGADGGRSETPAYTGIGDSTRLIAENGSDPGDYSLSGFSNMTVATDLPSWPARGNVKLVARFTTASHATAWFVCSGSMADAGVVQTAGHCVYARNPDGLQIFDWADEIYVYPAWDGVSTPMTPDSTDVVQHFGYARGTSFLAGTGYIDDGDFDRDVGAIRISRGSSRNVGALTGWFGWAWGFDCPTIQTRTYHNFSYPAQTCGGDLHTGQTLYYWQGRFDSCPGNQLRIDTTGGCFNAGWGGSSGSGIYWTEGDERHVHAVASNSNRSTFVQYARYWEQWINDRTRFVDDTRGDTLDLEALAFRATGATTVHAGDLLQGDPRVQIANATNADPAQRQYTLRVYLSTNNVISSTDTLLATWYYDLDFAAMQTRNLIVPAPRIPNTTASGTYWLGVILDPATDAWADNNDSSVWDAQRITVIGDVLFQDGFEP